ncbi:MAG: SUMF1/EgtB/PvdO family nonheme iron enzyme, partial [Planctomycetales bacterium]|nr:SUMF1/EgtB/PvdO family nonheme iron enzyme [Planctomycetales bacterium]
MDHHNSPKPNRSPSVDELLAEYHRRVDAGEAVDREQFLRRHPEAADELRSYFEGTDLVERLGVPSETNVPELPAGQSIRSAETIAPRGLSDSGEMATGPFTSLPAQFGRYLVDKLLGSGAMGSVYLAQDTQLDRPVALKVPRLSGQEGTEVIIRLQREAKAAANLNHPNICRVYDVGVEAGTYFIAMEYIDGRPLSDYVVPGHFHDERRCANVVRKMALALAEAHSKGIIHRDLKPANILINLRGEPVLTDFGLARILDAPQDGRATRSGMIIGSPAYMPPEQANGETDKICPASDIYSLGVLFFELLTSQLPFQGSVLTILSQIATKEPPLPSSLRPGLDPRLDVICCKMLAKKIADRFGSMTDVARELETWLTSPPIVTGGPDPLVRTSNHGIMPPPASSGPRGPDHGAEPTKDSIGGLLPISPKIADAKKSATLTLDDIARQKQRAQKLLGEHNYDAAISLLTKLTALKGTQFQETATWAKTTLPAAKEKQQRLRDQSAKACEKARALLSKLDYVGAAQTLESVPAGARNEEVRQLLSQANEKYEECLGLQQEIEEAVNRKKYDRLLPLVKRYLKLKPDSPKMERLARDLAINRPDRAVAHYKGRGKYFDVAGRLIEPKEIAMGAFIIVGLFIVVSYAMHGYLANRSKAELRVMVAEDASGERPTPQSVVPKPVRLTIQQLPAVLLKAGESQRFMVRVERENLNGDIRLEFQGLPSTVSVTGGIATVPSALDQVEVEFVADSEATDANADVRLVATLADLLLTQSFRLSVIGPLPMSPFPIGLRAGEERELSELKIKFCWCPPGSFTMGSPKSETQRFGNEDQVAVTLSQGFWMGKYEVTQGEWQQLMGTTLADQKAKPNSYGDITGTGAQQPMYFVNHDEATAFCVKLTEQERRGGRLPPAWNYELPTEAQWEYASRAGTTARFYWGDDENKLGDYAWHAGNSNSSTQTVGQKAPNAWGLHDTPGNVLEWCSTWHDFTLFGGTDPRGPTSGLYRCGRGATWTYPNARFFRSACRAYDLPSNRRNNVGFRLAAVPG